MATTAMRPGRIVIINDDRDFLDLMQTLLSEAEGYEVLVRYDSDRAYQFVKDQLPDLVILDIRMQGVDTGWSILKSLTLDPVTKPIPKIICSAAVPQIMAQKELLDRQGIDILPKPFDLEMLLERVGAAMERRPAPPSGEQG